MLTLRNILEAGLIKDDTWITVERPIPGPGFDQRRGKWYQDHILEYLDAGIERLSWWPAGGLTITVKKEG